MTLKYHYRALVMSQPAQTPTSPVKFHLVRKNFQVPQPWSIKVFTKMNLPIGEQLKNRLLSEPLNILITVCLSEVTQSTTCDSRRNKRRAISKVEIRNSSREAKAKIIRRDHLLRLVYRHQSQLLLSKFSKSSNPNCYLSLSLQWSLTMRPRISVNFYHSRLRNAQKQQSQKFRYFFNISYKL